MFRILLVATFAFVVFSDQNQAEAQNRRARFFQKIKQDLFGETQPSSEQKQTAQQTRPTRTPTLNQQRPAGSAAAQNQRRVPSVYRNQNNNKLDDSRFKPSVRETAKARPSGPTRNGFGFSVAENDNGQIVVSNVERGGNAAEAGIRRGDRIKEIGGIEAATAGEFDEIAKIMSAGDQMEFKIARSGQQKTLTVQYGESSEDVASSDSQDTSIISNNSRSTGNARRFDFAPPQQASQSQSILNRTSSRLQAHPASTIQNGSGADTQIRLLNQTIARQNQQIQALQRQVIQMQRNQRSR